MAQDYDGVKFNGNNLLSWDNSLKINANARNLTAIMTEKGCKQLKQLMTPQQIIDAKLKCFNKYGKRIDKKGKKKKVKRMFSKEYEQMVDKLHEQNSAALSLVQKSVESRFVFHVLDCVYAFDAIEQIKKFWNQNSTEHILELRDEIRTLPFADDSVTFMQRLKQLVAQLNDLGDKTYTLETLPSLVIERLPDTADYSDLKSLLNINSTVSGKSYTTEQFTRVLTLHESKLVRTKSLKAQNLKVVEAREPSAVNSELMQLATAAAAAAIEKEKKTSPVAGVKRSFDKVAYGDKCSNCGAKGHAIESCWYDGGGGVSKRPPGWQKENPYRSKQRSKITAVMAKIISCATALDIQADSMSWVCDSGSTAFVTCRKDWLIDYVEEPGLCRTADAANRVAIVGKGRMFFEYDVANNKSYVMASEVWYSPMFGYNLFPVNKFSKSKEMSALFNNGQVVVKNQNEIIATGELQANGDMEDLFVMDIKVVPPVEVARLGLMDQFTQESEPKVLAAAPISVLELHELLGHSNP